MANCSYRGEGRYRGKSGKRKKGKSGKKRERGKNGKQRKSEQKKSGKRRKRGTRRKSWRRWGMEEEKQVKLGPARFSGKINMLSTY